MTEEFFRTELPEVLFRSFRSDPLRAAVIGVGSMGSNHARVYSELPDVQLVGVADSDLPVAEKIGRAYQATAYKNYRQMLEDLQPQVVSVAAPTALHEEIVLPVLESGADVLVEKPIAASLAGAQRLIERAAQLKRILMVGHIERFNPAIQALKKFLQSGKFGRIYQITCRRVGPFPARIRDVGVVVDLATHDIDLLRYLTELEPIRVFAETEYGIQTGHTDLLLGLVHFPENIRAVLEINWLAPQKIREVSLLGEGGELRVNALTQEFYYQVGSSERVGSSGSTPPLGSTHPLIKELTPCEPLKVELQAFLNAVHRGYHANCPPPVSGEDGLAALRIALALEESGLTHQPVLLNG